MKNQNRKPLIGLIAITAALAMPLALAQETTDSSASAQTQTAEPQTQTQDATDATSTDATSATGAATTSAQESGASGNVRGGKNDWASLDVDTDGNISKEESAGNPGLAQIFDKADADADGKLTVEEYNTYVSKNYGEPQK
jgi:hypothetical protein